MRTILTQTIASQEAGVGNAHRQKQRGHFARWERFLASVGISDPWLEKCSQEERATILCAFAESVRRNHHGTTSLPILRHGTVDATVGGVRATFRSHFRGDAGAERLGELALALKRQLNGYGVNDPPERHEKALPIRVFKHIW